MATLTGKQIANTYKRLLQVGTNNDGLTSALQTVQDGNGDNSALQLSNSIVNINGTLQLNGSALTADASALNAITDLTGITGLVAMNSGSALGRTLTAGAGVTIGNANGTAGNPNIALSVTGVTSGSYGPFTTFDVNQFGRITSAVAVSASISAPTIRATEFIGERLNLSDKLSVTGTGNITGIVSLGNNVAVSGALTVKGTADITGNVSIAGNIKTAHVSSGGGTFSGVVSATNFVGDGSGLTNVPSAEGGTMKRVDAGTGIKMTVGGAVSSSIPVSGVIAVSADQNFGTVSVSTAFVATGSAVFGTLSATNIDADELLMAGVSAANVTQVAAVSALTKTNLDAITSINTIIGDGGNFATSAELATVSAALATSIGNSNTNIAAVSVLTSVNAAAITSANTVIAAVSALTKTNLDAVTSINTVVANLSGTMATSINNRTAAITSINTVITDLSATIATSINNRTAAITSINTVITNLSATMATSVNNSRTIITSVNNLAVAVSALTKTNLDAITSVNTVITNLSATMATSIGNRLALTGGTLTGIVSGTDFYVSAVAVGTNSLLGKDIHIEKAAVADIQALTDGTNISVDLNAGQNFTVTLAGNRTLDNPTNCVAGQVGSIFVVQDGTGSRTLAYGTSWDFPAGEAPVLSTDAAAIDRIDYIVHTSTDVHAVLTKAYS